MISPAVIIFDTAVADGTPQYLARLLVAQARHETANFTSKFFIAYHNCFGYSKDKRSKWQVFIRTPNADNKIPIGAYNSIENSVHELTAPNPTGWIYRRQKKKQFPQDLKTIDSPEKYVKLLKDCGYFGDTLDHYLAGVKHYNDMA